MTVMSEEQTMLRDMAREWVDNESPVSAFRRLRDRGDDNFDAATWSAMGEMGWAGIVIGEEYGGSDLGMASLGLVAEQLGRNLVASPLLTSAVAASAIRSGGDDRIRNEHLPRLASGGVTATLAVDEGPRHDMRIATVANEGRLTGTKAFVAEGSSAGLFVVAARDGLYLVTDGNRVSRSARKMADARDHAFVDFDEAPAERLGGIDLTARVVDRATAVTAAEMLGMADSAFSQTLSHLKQRVQFGQPLSTFQALQHRMARLYTEIELMRSAVEDALAALDDERPDADQAVSLAKAVAGDTLKLATREMIQLFGGVGMTDEYDAGLYLKRAAVLENAWGNASYHRDRFGRLNGY